MMIVLLNRNGQTCNQMLQIASTLARGIRYKQRVRCINIDPQIFSFFDFNKKIMEENNIYLKTTKWCDQAAKIIARVKKIFKYKKKFKIKKVGFNLISDWESSVDYDSLKYERDKILAIIHFKHTLVEEYNKFLKENIKNQEVVIGVHIRRGDYKFFENGKYYYSDREYSKWMQYLYQSNPNVVFLLCGNEKVDEQQYVNLPVYFMNGSASEDLYCLSRCDYIMGPPSSFSRWAAYMGGNKRAVLKEKSKDYAFDDFYDYSEDKFYESH